MILNHLSSIGNVVEAGKGLAESVLEETSIQFLDFRTRTPSKLSTHIIAPPDSSIVTTADPSAVVRSRSVCGLAGDRTQILDTTLDILVVGLRILIACYRIPLLESKLPFLVGVQGSEFLLVVGVNCQQLFVDLLHCSIEIDFGAARGGLDFPGEVLDAISRDRSFDGVGLKEVSCHRTMEVVLTSSYHGRKSSREDRGKIGDFHDNNYNLDSGTEQSILERMR